MPSRTRVARSGPIGATTVFVTGHGYDSVDFSTETLLVDTTGTVGNSVWTIAADGSSAAERFLAGASSPALTR